MNASVGGSEAAVLVRNVCVLPNFLNHCNSSKLRTCCNVYVYVCTCCVCVCTCYVHMCIHMCMNVVYV